MVTRLFCFVDSMIDFLIAILGLSVLKVFANADCMLHVAWYLDFIPALIDLVYRKWLFYVHIYLMNMVWIVDMEMWL